MVYTLCRDTLPAPRQEDPCSSAPGMRIRPETSLLFAILNRLRLRDVQPHGFGLLFLPAELAGYTWGEEWVKTGQNKPVKVNFLGAFDHIFDVKTPLPRPLAGIRHG